MKTPPPRALLNRAGPAVQHAYLFAFLRMLHQYECVRMFTVAFALFPNRTQTAASAAAQRVVTNAKKLRYIRSLNWMDGHRYYALTELGASFLNELDAELCAHSTVPTLRLENKRHRHWGVLIAIASAHRGAEGFSESLISGDMHSDITQYFGHTPDAVTVTDDACVWHEVETSRRSTSRKSETPDKMCGVEKLSHLVLTLREKRTLEHRGWAYPLTLIMHCVGGVIERSVRATIEAAITPLGGTPNANGYSVSCDGADNPPFIIIINMLPQEPEGPEGPENGTWSGAWSGVLPWRSCGGEVTSTCDQYLQTPC